MFQGEHLIMRPVKVIRDEGYLLVQRIERVADYPPAIAISGANAC
jgi:hypothetical protein